MFYVKLYLQAVQPQISSGLRIRRIRGAGVGRLGDVLGCVRGLRQ